MGGQGDLLLLRPRGRASDGPAHRGRGVDLDHDGAQPVLVEPAQVQEVVDQPDRLVGGVEHLECRRRHRGRVLLAHQHLGPAEHRGERIPELVVHHREEALAGALQLLDLLEEAGTLVVESRVVDRGGGLRREEPGQVFILLGEFGHPLLLGEVEIAEDPRPPEDRGAEEGVHDRMVGREADRVGVLLEIGEPDQPRLADEEPEDPVPPGEGAESLDLLGRDPGDDEPFEDAAVGGQHAEGRVARADDGAGRIGHQLEDAVEGVLAGERETRFEDRLEPDLGGRGAIGHRPKVTLREGFIPGSSGRSHAGATSLPGVRMSPRLKGVERAVRLILGIAALSFFGALPSPARYLTLIGLPLIATALVGWCPLYLLFPGGKGKGPAPTGGAAGG